MQTNLELSLKLTFPLYYSSTGLCILQLCAQQCFLVCSIWSGSNGFGNQTVCRECICFDIILNAVVARAPRCNINIISLTYDDSKLFSLCKSAEAGQAWFLIYCHQLSLDYLIKCMHSHRRLRNL